MAWNIGLLCIKADIATVERDFIDVFSKSKEGLHFEAITSISMDTALGIGYYHPWTLIFDVRGRFNESLPLKIDKKYKVKMFWISEDLIYRDYHFSFFRKGGIKTEVNGIEEGRLYLSSKGITGNEWGEDIAFQIIEKEIMNESKQSIMDTLWQLKYAKYELD